MNSQNEQKNRFICNLATSIIIILCGTFLLLCGLKVIPLLFSDIALPAILLSFGIIFVATAFVQNNSVSLWMSAFFIIPAFIALIVAYSSLNYSNMYPFFISAPTFASLFALILSREYRTHLFAALFFGVLTLLFCFQSFEILGWGEVLPLLTIFLGIVILIFTLSKKSAK